MFCILSDESKLNCHPLTSSLLQASLALGLVHALLLAIDADVDHGEESGLLAKAHLHQIMGQDAELVEGVVGVVRLSVALVD